MKVGDIYRSNAYGKFKIVTLVNSRDSTVEFIDTGYTTKTNPNNIENGRVKDKLMPTVFDIGFIGDGEHKANTAAYRKWSGMISRCYNELNKSYKSYSDCTIDDEWFNYQNFASWFYDQDAPNDFELDKDTLIDGNRVYSPETCLLISKSDNIKAKVASNDNNKHGYAGVYMTTYKDAKYFAAKITINGKRVNISGGFRTAKDAHEALQLRKAQLRGLANN